jgi:hypothetical protein
MREERATCKQDAKVGGKNRLKHDKNHYSSGRIQLAIFPYAGIVCHRKNP